MRASSVVKSHAESENGRHRGQARCHGTCGVDDNHWEGQIETTPQIMYASGDLRYYLGQLIIAFLEEWRATGPPEPDKTRIKHGELKQIRSMLRDRYAQHRVGSHFNFNTIRFAMETRPEWDEWREQLFGERAAKNAEKKRAKAERAEKRAVPGLDRYISISVSAASSTKIPNSYSDSPHFQQVRTEFFPYHKTPPAHSSSIGPLHADHHPSACVFPPFRNPACPMILTTAMGQAISDRRLRGALRNGITALDIKHKASVKLGR
ncbi:hypothetical protein C8R45DRAFT_921578 [Mycena sanguinolenta]|nr:hypothetical protein C8R45DRAFT_921578 [Mycena sanguinolenta]